MTGELSKSEEYDIYLSKFDQSIPDILQKIATKWHVFEILQVLQHLQLPKIQDKAPYKSQPWLNCKPEIEVHPFWHEMLSKQ